MGFGGRGVENEKGSVLLGLGEHSAKVDTAPIFILTQSFPVSVRLWLQGLGSWIRQARAQGEGDGRRAPAC